MNVHPTTTNYLDDRYNLIRRFEGQYLYAYNDSVGIATIGVGTSLEANGRLLLQTLGFNIGSTTVLQGAALTLERSYITRLIAAMNSDDYPAGTISPPPENNPVYNALNVILAERANNSLAANAPYLAYPNFPRTTQFRLASEAASRNVFNQVMAGYQILGVNGVTAVGKETEREA